MPTRVDQRVEDLIRKLNPAIKEMNEARVALVSRSKIVGELLLKAKTIYPKVKDFEAFLKRVDGLHLSRAYELMRLAGGRTTDEAIRKDTRDRVKKHRDKKAQLSKPEPDPEISVTVTETKLRDPMADLSARSLAEFKYACRLYLPKLDAGDLKQAYVFVSCGMWHSKQNEAA